MAISKDKTYDWHLANLVIGMMRKYPSLISGLTALGNGVLYDGLLDTDCTIDAYHEAHSGDVVSKCILTLHKNGKEEKREIGTLFGSDAPVDGTLPTTNGKTFIGTMDSTGIASDEVVGGSTRFILKDLDGGKNNVNTVWLNDSLWQSNYGFDIGVGVLNDDGNGGFDGDFSHHAVLDDEDDSGIQSAYSLDLPTMLTMTPLQENGVTYGYTVVMANDEPSAEYRVVFDNVTKKEYVHFIAKCQRTGTFRRFVANITDGYVSKFWFNPMEAKTVDFSTPYSLDALHNGLVQNFKQHAINYMVQTMMTNTSSSSIGELQLASGLRLDMFTDQTSLKDYELGAVNPPSDEYKAKFLEVFKNHVVEVDDFGMDNGLVYGHVKSALARGFGDNLSLVLVDAPSFVATRSSDQDTFTSTIKFDIHVHQNKSLLESLYIGNPVTYEDKYILCDAVVKDVECKMEIKPTLIWSGAAPSIKYTSKYTITNKPYSVEYSKIAYAHNGYVTIKSLSEAKTASIRLSYPGEESAPTSIADLTSEDFKAGINDLLDGKADDILMGVNNAVSSTEKEIVDYESKFNPVLKEGTWTYNNIWNLGENVPSTFPPGSRLVGVDYGNVILSGSVYDVKQGIKDGTLVTTLKNRDSETQYGIQSQKKAAFEQKFVVMYTGDGSSYVQRKYAKFSSTISYVDSPDTADLFNTWSDANDKITSKVSNVEEQKKYVVQSYDKPNGTENALFAMGTSSVTKSYIDDNFNLVTIGDGLCLQFKPGSGLPPPSSAEMGIPVAELVNLDKYTAWISDQGEGSFDYTETELNYILIDDPFKSSEVDDSQLEYVGPSLFDDESEKFEVSESNVNESHETTIYLEFSGKQLEETPTDKPWLGMKGKFKV